MRAWNGSGNEASSNETETHTAANAASTSDAHADATMNAMPENAGTTPAEEASQSESAPSAVEEPVQKGTDTSSQSDAPQSDDAHEFASSQEHKPDEPSQQRKRVPISALYPKQKAPAQFTPKNTGAQRPAIKPDAVQSQPEQHGDDDTPPNNSHRSTGTPRSSIRRTDQTGHQCQAGTRSCSARIRTSTTEYVGFSRRDR